MYSVFNINLDNSTGILGLNRKKKNRIRILPDNITGKTKHVEIRETNSKTTYRKAVLYSNLKLQNKTP